MTKSRIIFIDHIKAFCLLSVIIAHSSSPFFTYSWWYFKFANPADFFPLYLYKYVLFTFNIGLFFFISGYFIASTGERRSFGDYFKRRVMPIIPLLFFFIIFISPFLLFFYHTNINSIDYGFWTYIYRDFLGFGPQPTKWQGPVWPEWVNLGHLWFVQYTLIFSSIYLLLKEYLSKHNSIRVSKIPEPGNISFIIAALVLGSIYFVMKIWYPSRIWIYPLFGLPFDPSLFLQYPIFFILGILCYKNKWDLKFPKVSLSFWAIISTIALILLFYYFFNRNVNFWTTSGMNWNSFIASMIEANLGIGLSFLTIRFFKKYLDRPSIFSFISANSFGIYYLHLPIMVLLHLIIAGYIIHQYQINIYILIFLCVVSTILISLGVLKTLRVFGLLTPAHK